MPGKRLRWFWWMLAVLLIGAGIWYAVWNNKTEDYPDGTLVINPTEVFRTANRNYCHLITFYKPIKTNEEGA